MSKHTDRYDLVDCPACDGEGGAVQEEYAGYDSYYGPAVREYWEPCEACDGSGKVQRVDRLAYLIGEARESEARLTPSRPAIKPEPIVIPAAPFPLRKAA